MRLGEVSVWFPVLHLRAKVTYRLLPELTPLHRALEEAVVRFSQSDNTLAKAPIGSLFREVFGVSGAREILPDVLGDLIERGRVHRVAEHEIDPSLLRLADLAPGPAEPNDACAAEPSEQAQKSAQDRTIERFFDPVLEEIVEAGVLLPEPVEGSCFRIPVDPFATDPPRHWIDGELRADLQDDMQVYNATCEKIGHRWRRSNAILALNDGELSFECSDPRESEYLRGLPQTVRRSWLLPDRQDGSNRSRLDDDAEVSLHCRLPEGLDGLTLVRGLPEAISTELDFPSLAVLAKLDPVAGVTAPTFISPPARGQAMRVAYPREDNPGVAGVFLAREGREYLRLPIIWEGLHAEIGVFRRTGGFAQSGSEWSELVAALESECRFSEAPEIFVLPAFWLKPAEFWMGLIDRVRHEPGSQTWMQRIVDALEILPRPVIEGLVETLASEPSLAQFRRSQPELGRLDPTATELVSEINEQSREVGHIPPECDRVVAFDTSAILEFGDLADHLLPTDFFVFPQTVADEIERKKTQRDDFRWKSRKNLRAISTLPKNQWTAPFPDVSYLKSGDKRNADGEIIAVLIPYRQPDRKIILVSQDLDFVPRCKSYDIDVMTAEVFIAESKTRRRDIQK
ncbi:hypothetical protein HKX29_16930 [Sulfitobacter sp. S46]|uniref:PIN domain-containing protein n=1 Tax=unclassified Sulfitobacter TaxID=196795 RepID=UPI0023E11DEE|nr:MULTISPECIES: PIN domain-containing protein [unclassified Sulfitobacter]MDF3419989.1 hypothetical protein [Sulfitobacter sp. Ks38]MDF3431104.1 hypothetical protein [Sulfitobacter sp. S46]MDF3445844.1 hypothetical protein [Sulfitobacter sp. KE31]MDF3549696.1 hypothetical protein [Sulfitobacter sp. KE28]